MRILAILCLACAWIPFAATAGSKPNFLVILADDMSYHDIGAWGNKDVKTPHLDRLASEGLKLTRIFTPAPTCSPTRHALYTGLYPVKSGAHPNHAVANPGTRSMPHYLAPLGYRVALAGKTHIDPLEVYPFEYIRSPERKPGQYSPEDAPQWNTIEQFIRRDDSQPFCLVFASNEPHSPWTKGDVSVFDPDRLTLPSYFVDTPETRRALAHYYAEISVLDNQVGRLMAMLQEHRKHDNTVVIFLSEQGSSFPHCKWTLYDTGIRASGIVRWPGKVKPGSKSDALIQYVDVLPTLLEAAGGQLAEAIDGRSFLRVLTGRQKKFRDHVFGIQTTRGIINGSPAYGIRCVRDERYKYIWNLNPEAEFSNDTTAPGKAVFASWREKAKDDPFARARVTAYVKRPEIEFYDLENDPFEMHNLADHPKYQKRMVKLRKALDAWMTEQGDMGVATELAALGHMRPEARKRALRELEQHRK